MTRLRHCAPARSRGSPLGLSELQKVLVPFVQDGVLIKKLGINCVPGLVSQEGDSRQIAEIPLLKKGQ